MIDTFLYFYIFFLDESMVVWLENYTLSYWIVVTHKRHPFENECNTVLCYLCGILFHMDFVDGKDWQPHLYEIFLCYWKYSLPFSMRHVADLAYWKIYKTVQWLLCHERNSEAATEGYLLWVSP